MLARDTVEKLEEKIKNMLAAEGIVGCSVALTDRQGVVYSRGFGKRIVELVDAPSMPDSIYRAASITKVVTGMLTMQLVAEGKLELDAPVIRYLPWLTLKDGAAAKSITVRHLLSHRSGLPAEYTPEGPLDEGMLVDSLKVGLPTLDLVGAPGEKYLYSNWGIRLLSAAIEAVTGERYSALAMRRILLPIGMTDTTFFRCESMDAKLSMPHVIGENDTPVSEKSIKENFCRLATGGLYSTAIDLCRLARVILNGGVADSGERIISREQLALMMREVTHHDSGNGYGLTMQLHPARDLILYGHYGNADPYTSSMFCDIASGYGAVVMLNTYSKDLRANICDAIISAATKEI